jgi:hypothetical protein
MEKYRQEIQKQIRGGAIIIALTIALFSTLHVFLYPKLTNPATVKLISYLEGLIMGVVFVLIIQIFIRRKALKDETSLRKLYNEEHDERTQFIRQKAGEPLMAITGAIIMTAGAVSAYFHPIVSYTLMGAGLFVILVGILVKIWVARKY